jgi:cyanophycin synthetase
MPKLNASSRIIFEEAQKLGITCTTFDDNETILMEYHGKTWYTRGSRSSLQSSVGKTIADNKPITKSVLLHFGLPTAQGIVVGSATDLTNLAKLKFPVVMKPIDERHGKDVHVDIKNLASATKLFTNYGKKVLFEEMLQGTEYRIVCINYRFIAAAFRKPAFVVGDGTLTITELVAEKNKHPWRGSGHENNLSLITIDSVVAEYLTEQNLTPDSILEVGREVFLRKTANLSTGGEAWDVTDTVCTENRELFEKIAKACDLNTVGIDIMCGSLETPITAQENAGVIEVNASPGLRMHHFPMQGTPKNIAKIILNMIMEVYAK